ncbi:MAG TPA: N-acetylmuramoyl-L-alanine amidase [Roseiflexaceae bacterium]|nr:N-acetylmuramoyl-L-alanine amidase [Roseiflexaceae bacterium]
MSDDSPFQKQPADLLPFEEDSAAPGQVPMVLGEVEPEKFLYIGKGLTADEFSSYVQSYNFGTIPPDYVVLHHTANPCTLAASYPAGRAWDGGEDGMSAEQVYQKRQRGLLNMREFYRINQQWDRGPHLYIDDRYIWLFTPMYEVGIHAKEGNSYHDANGQLHYSIGIEVIGYYEHTTWPEPVANMVGHAVAVLKRQLGSFDLSYKPGPLHTPSAHVHSIASHRDFNKPQCPGAAITEAYYCQVINASWDRLSKA